MKYPTTKLASSEYNNNDDENNNNHDSGNENEDRQNNHNNTNNTKVTDSIDGDHHNILTDDDEFEMNEEIFREKMSKSFKKLASVPVWYEQFDENGYPYYYNPRTGESKWEPPEWIENIDPSSGARYILFYIYFLYCNSFF